MLFWVFLFVICFLFFFFFSFLNFYEVLDFFLRGRGGVCCKDHKENAEKQSSRLLDRAPGTDWRMLSSEMTMTESLECHIGSL